MLLILIFIFLILNFILLQHTKYVFFCTSYPESSVYVLNLQMHTLLNVNVDIFVEWLFEQLHS